MESVVAETEDIQSSTNFNPKPVDAVSKIRQSICAVCRLIFFSVYKALGSAVEIKLQGKERTVAMIKNKITLPTASYWKPNNFITAPLMRAMNESAPVKTAPQMRRVNIFSLLFTQKVFKSSDTFPLQIFRKNLWRQRKPTISFIPKVSAPVRL